MLIVGLGNPGKEYESTRHNLGFMLVDKLAHDEGINVNRRECSALVGRGEIEGTRTQLVKPQTFMNLSGHAVACLLARIDSDAPIDQLVVVSDDLALPLGRIRIRERGSAGGHNGLKSIISVAGTEEFIRLRIGIQPQHPVEDTRRFVLASFSKSDRVAVEEVLAKSAAAIEAILTVGPLKAM